MRDEAGGDGSELTKGLCAQRSNVVSKAEGSPGRVSSRGVAPRSPWHQQGAWSWWRAACRRPGIHVEGGRTGEGNKKKEVLDQA